MGSAEGVWPCWTPKLGGARRGQQRGHGPAQVHHNHLDTELGGPRRGLQRGGGPAHASGPPGHQSWEGPGGSAEGAWPCTCTRTPWTPELGGPRRICTGGCGPAHVHFDFAEAGEQGVLGTVPSGGELEKQ